MKAQLNRAPTEAQSLIDWFDRHRRDLPWRRDRDPYRVWLSEIMLQQTRVQTVIPYYEAFLARFPSVGDLAAAPLDAVLSNWSGLGYYRRARQLHAAATEVALAGGTFPATVAGLLELPGIGAYTAAAIASICFDVVVPVLDGNVERVLTRKLAQEGEVKSSLVRRRLIEEATGLLDPQRPGDSNQALMELGATICTPKRPQCLLCPLAEECSARLEGTQESYPKARAERATEEIAVIAVLVEDDQGRTLLFRRPEDSSLLAGLWEVPWTESSGTDVTEELGRRYGGNWRLGKKIGAARHGITYRDLRVTIYRGEIAGGGEVREGPEAGWFTFEQIGELGTSSLVAKILGVGRADRGLRGPKVEAKPARRRPPTK